MNYYEKIYEIPALPNYYFKINRIKPTRIYAMTVTFGKVMNPDAKADPEALEKVGDFIVESLLFSTSKEGPFKPVQLPGLDSFEFPELERNPMCLLYFTQLYFENVIQTAQNI